MWCGVLWCSVVSRGSYIRVGGGVHLHRHPAPVPAPHQAKEVYERLVVINDAHMSGQVRYRALLYMCPNGGMDRPASRKRVVRACDASGGGRRRAQAQAQLEGLWAPLHTLCAGAAERPTAHDGARLGCAQ